MSLGPPEQREHYSLSRYAAIISQQHVPSSEPSCTQHYSVRQITAIQMTPALTKPFLAFHHILTYHYSPLPECNGRSHPTHPCSCETSWYGWVLLASSRTWYHHTEAGSWEEWGRCLPPPPPHPQEHGYEDSCFKSVVFYSSATLIFFCLLDHTGSGMQTYASLLATNAREHWEKCFEQEYIQPVLAVSIGR